MTVTEQEARSKWCPMISTKSFFCEGSHCMAWEWTGNAMYGDERDDKPDRKGYCSMGIRRDK